jgi:hypothetical protein
MWPLQRRCTLARPLPSFALAETDRFVDCEKWRKEFNLDYLVRHFDYTEKQQVFQYYPQYYHKTDKVRMPPHRSRVQVLIRN